MKKILILEDDPQLSAILKEQLEERGYSCIACLTLADACKELEKITFDLAIIDIGLPDGNGFTLATKIQSTLSTPFIFLTAMNSPEFRLEGFEIGAADYIPKPFHMKELALRVSRILGQNQKKGILINNGVKLDPDTRTLTINEGKEISLAEREFLFLYHLVSSTPRIISRDEVLNKVWQKGEQANSRTVDNIVVKLRQLLGDEYSDKLVSVRGMGYQWV